MQTVLTGGRLIDGTGTRPIENATVLIEGDAIKFAGATEDLGAVGGDVMKVDVSGKTVMPGLINSHVHLCINPDGVYGNPNVRDVTKNTLEGYGYALQCLHRGVTSLGELSAPHHGFIHLARLIDAGRLRGPRIVNVGKGLAVSGGHAYYLGREIDGPVEAAKAAREEMRAGADQVKLLAEAGSLEDAFTLRRLEMTKEEMTAAIDAARSFGKMVRAHLLTSECVEAGVEVGVDVVEHGYDLEDPVIDLLVEKGIYLVPTAQVWKMPLMFPKPDDDPGDAEVRRYTQELVEATLPRAIERGVKIALGTDGNTVRNPSWEVVVELQLLVEYGMSRLQAITAGTQTAAEVLGLGAVLGSVTEGKLADVLVIDGNPLDDLEELRKVAMVIKNGEIVRS